MVAMERNIIWSGNVKPSLPTPQNVRVHKLVCSSLLERLLPSDLLSWYAHNDKGGPASNVALVQANFFDCGGVAVAALLWHRVFDAAAISSFIRSWAAAARGSSTDPACPNFISQSLFPQKQELVTQSRSALDYFKKGNAVIRKLVLSAAAVSKLKAECGGGTRVEAVSALIWKCFMAASLANNNANSVLSQAVNLRRRARPPFSSECFGSWIGLAVAASSNESKAELGLLVSKIRDSVRMVDGEYVDRLRGDDGLAGYRENRVRGNSVVPAGGGDVLYLTSWCGLGFYSSIDFGWGTPAQMTGAFDWKTQFVNFVSLIDMSGDEGVEACVVLDDKYLEVFEQQVLKTLAH